MDQIAKSFQEINVKPLVSICIPAYNQTGFLQKALESVCQQDYERIEVVITDDSTNNAVEELVAGYINKLSVSYHKNPTRLGSPANWNKALMMAKGELIKFVHHDDWLAHPYSVEHFAREFVKDPAVEMVFCNSRILNVERDTYSTHQPDLFFLKDLKNRPAILFNNNQVGSPTAVMFRKNLIQFDTRLKYLVDIDFYIRLLNGDKKFVYLDEALIVNTSNHEAQVTTASLNKETQVGEYCYLYNKVFKDQIPGIGLSLFFVRLFRKYHLKKIEEIKELGSEIPEPAWYFRFLLILSKLKK